MKLVRKRISDPHLLGLIESWLESGVMEDGRFLASNGLGTPQGSVISPLLANIYLHSFDKMFQQSGIPGLLVRYCDDFVVLLKRNGKTVLKRVKEMLSRLKLTLHPTKTRIVHVANGFDFLGMHFRLSPVKKKGSRLTHSCRLWPSNKSMKRIRERIRQVIGGRYSLSLEEIIKELNPMIRGWNNYHSVPASQRKRLLVLNGFVFNRLRIFLKRKYNDQTRGLRRISGYQLFRLGLIRFG
ncbi:maturase [bacterium]|nr:maturase [bacterium]